MSHILGHLGHNFATKNKIMTLKQLLDSLTFDEIAPCILNRYKNCDVRGLLALYKQHFDYLRSLVPTDPDLIERKEARISLYKEGENIYLDAFPLEGDCWEDSLSKELVIDDEVEASNAEIAACCLWHTSFYGYLPYQCEETFDNLFDGIVKKGALLSSYKEKFSDIIPSKREMAAIASFHNEVRSRMKYYRHRRRTEQNKRDELCLSFEKRCWRSMKRRIINHEYYKRISFCSSFIDSILGNGCGIDKQVALQELSTLYVSSHVVIRRLGSIAFSAEKRLDYLSELIEKYGALDDIPHYANSFICLSTSSHYPITEDEKKIISILTNGQIGTQRLYVKTDDHCGKEMRIDVAFYEH